MDKDEFIKALLDHMRNEGIPFSLEQARLSYGHIELMLEWNRKHNLTRITSLDEILANHLMDSLIPGQWLPKAGAALDVGTGAGFPGIPLKILHPGLRMVLLEAHRKKISFLRVLLSRIKLENTWALQGRWEEFTRIGNPLTTQRYDLITMRAVRLEPRQLSYFGSKILDAGGVFAWWAGPSAGTEHRRFRESSEAAQLAFEKEYTYRLPSVGTYRRLFVWKKIK